MDRLERIRQKITQALAPSQLEIVDQSALHAGHAGAAPGGQTHYLIRMSAESLQGKTRVAQHQAIYKLLDDEFKLGLHALAIEIIAQP